MNLFAGGLYFGWLWNNRGASEYRQLLASIRFRKRVKRRKAQYRCVMKELDNTPKSSAHLNLNRASRQELRTAD